MLNSNRVVHRPRKGIRRVRRLRGTIYYYSPYERVIWEKLHEAYSDVCDATFIQNLFARDESIDLYHDVANSKIIWPTEDHSVKTLAGFLGFNWRDTNPSGAASVRWFDDYYKSGDQAMRQRILDYNEDDCIAMRVLLDGVREL